VEALAAALVAQGVRPGDVYALYGDVGAGKSVFSRAFVRAAAQDPYLPVPSPTFLLQNIYDESCLGEGSTPIHHFDFYRLPAGQQASFSRLNLPDSFQHAACLLEWPEQLPANQLPPQHMAIHIKIVTQATVEQAHQEGQAADGHQQEQELKHLPQSAQSGEQTVNARYEQPGVNGASSRVDTELDEDEDEDALFTDRRPRELLLQPHGQYWVERTRALLELIRAQGL
jgi:tRNA threonylcarbamoyl adenosine modification protein YjeE